MPNIVFWPHIGVMQSMAFFSLPHNDVVLLLATFYSPENQNCLFSEGLGNIYIVWKGCKLVRSNIKLVALLLVYLAYKPFFMFDEILKTVKEHFADNPQLAAAIPADQHDAVHNEIAQHVANQLSAADTSSGSTVAAGATGASTTVPAVGPAAGGGMSGMLDKLKQGLTSGNPVVNAIEGGLVSSLASKFGMGSAVTGAIAASLPGLLQKFAGKTATAPQ